MRKDAETFHGKKEYKLAIGLFKVCITVQCYER